MKRILMSAALLSTSLGAQEIGLGVILGSPTGFSANYRTSDSHSIDAALAYSLIGDTNLHVHSNYLWRYPRAIKTGQVDFGWFWGLGAKFRTHEGRGDESDYRIGPRVVAGVNHEFRKVPIEVFLEAALVMHVIPETDADIDVGLGGRYYF